MLRGIGKPVELRIDPAIVLEGDLAIPASSGKKGLIIFAHGSGSSRLSPRNIGVAGVLKNAGFGTLLFDLLTEKEDQNYETRFDIKLLARRLEGATHWVVKEIGSESLRIGYFGASTGAAAALEAAAELGPRIVNAVVSRGGRPDMAWGYLPKVIVPTLLIVGGRDDEVMKLNRSALKHIASPKKQLVVIPSATHLFEEPGTLDDVARHATDWFREFL